MRRSSARLHPVARAEDDQRRRTARRDPPNAHSAPVLCPTVGVRRAVRRVDQPHVPTAALGALQLRSEVIGQRWRIRPEPIDRLVMVARGIVTELSLSSCHRSEIGTSSPCPCGGYSAPKGSPPACATLDRCPTPPKPAARPGTRQWPAPCIDALGDRREARPHFRVYVQPMMNGPRPFAERGPTKIRTLASSSSPGDAAA